MQSTSESTTFRVALHMRMPAIIQGELPLESLLASCVHERHGAMRDEALTLVPIDSIDTPDGKIWMASSVMFDGKVRSSTHTFVRGRHFTEIGNDFYDGNPRARIDQWAVEQSKGDFIRLMNPYTQVEVDRMVWYATGDMHACEQLMKDHVQWIGKRRGSGMGEVSGVTVTPWHGSPVLDSNGMVRRPIAIRRLRHLSGAMDSTKQRVLQTVDLHPFWLHEPELCAVPLSKRETRELPEKTNGEMFFG